MQRRTFLKNSSLSSAGLLLSQAGFSQFPLPSSGKKKLAIVGTGHRGTLFWGKAVVEQFGDIVELASLCDINPGRMLWAKQRIGVHCNTFTDFDLMMRRTKPDIVIVTTVDATHDHFIVKALEMGADVITEKPMTTDEDKCRAILEAEKRSGKKVTVAFNYRHGPHMLKIREILESGRAGKITSVDFNWMLNVHHGSDYFRRWHGLKDKSGTLWVHKATHHFDLLNWWLNSEPVEVTAYGALEHYGKNNPFRGINCRKCEHKKACRYYLDITKNEALNGLYVQQEKYDGYFRDGCVWRNEIDIYDKMSAQIKYANGVLVNYSLTTYSPYEGWRITFNGFDGRIETWQDIPYLDQLQVDQKNRHAREMAQDEQSAAEAYRDVLFMKNFSQDTETIQVPLYAGGHGGGDQRMLHRIFRDSSDNPYHILAGTRDGAMSLLIGVAARKSIEQNRAVKISELTDLVPKAIKS